MNWKRAMMFCVLGVLPAMTAAQGAAESGVRPAWFRAHGSHGDHGEQAGALGCHGGHRWSLDEAAGYAEQALEITPAQRPLWQALLAQLRLGEARWREACKAAASQGEAETAPERLVALERLAAAGAATLAELRPSFEAFYVELEPAQRRHLDAWLDRRDSGREQDADVP